MNDVDRTAAFVAADEILDLVAGDSKLREGFLLLVDLAKRAPHETDVVVTEEVRGAILEICEEARAFARQGSMSGPGVANFIKGKVLGHDMLIGILDHRRATAHQHPPSEERSEQ